MNRARHIEEVGGGGEPGPPGGGAGGRCGTARVSVVAMLGARVERLGDHLVGRGCQLIGMISGPADVPASNDRISGFRRSMARRGHSTATRHAQMKAKVASARLPRRPPDANAGATVIPKEG